MVLYTIPTAELEQHLANARKQYAEIVSQGGYAPRLFLIIDNLRREIEFRKAWQS